jgi:hypothetical protein
VRLASCSSSIVMFLLLNPYMSNASRTFFASVIEPGSGLPPRALLIPTISACRFDAEGTP